MIYDGNDYEYFKYTHEDKSFCNQEMTLNQETESSNKTRDIRQRKTLILTFTTLNFQEESWKAM